MITLNLKELAQHYQDTYHSHDEGIEQELINDLHEIIEDALIKEFNLKKIKDYEYELPATYIFKKKYNSQVNAVKILLKNHIEAILGDFNLDETIK
jgi:hypothetical protein